MENHEVLYLTGGLINCIFQLVLIVACAILLSKKRNLATVLMFLGSLLSLLAFGLSFFGNTIIAQQGGAEGLVQFSAIVSIVGQIPHILFAIGFLLFILQKVKEYQKIKT